MDQQRLAQKASADADKLFDNLFRYVKNPENLLLALDTVLANKGAYMPGIDGITKGNIHSKTFFVDKLHEELTDETYQPQPVKRVYVPNSNGSIRSLGIPILKDRVVQEAVRRILEPVFESAFVETSTGFRLKRSAQDAISWITARTTNNQKFWWAIVGDITGCFDQIPHRGLLRVIRKKIICRKTLKLIKSFLTAGFIEEGKLSTPNQGVLSAGVLSPLLVNIYLNEMDQHWWNNYGSLKPSAKDKRRREGLGNVSLIRHADVFVLLTNGTKDFATSLIAEFTEVIKELELEVSREKTKLTHVDDGFEFLGFHIQRKYSKLSKKKVTLVHPSKDAVRKLWDKVGRILSKHNLKTAPAMVFHALNKLILDWDNYYRICNRGWNDRLNNILWEKVMKWLQRKHANVSAKGSTRKYAYMLYRRPKNAKTIGLGQHGVHVRRFSEKRWKHRAKPLGNPYLNEETVVYCGEDYSLVSDLWKGSSSKEDYIHLWEALISRDKGCISCGTTSGLHIHHIVPQAKGGRHTVDNTCLLCKGCHRAEHAKR